MNPNHTMSHRNTKTATAAALLATAAAVTVWAAIQANSPPTAQAAPQAPARATATISRTTLSSQITLDATLGYTGTYSVDYPTGAANSSNPNNADGSGTSNDGDDGNSNSGGSGGSGSSSSGNSSSGHGSSNASQPPEVFTKLPEVGQVVTPGHGLYSVNGTPTVLLSGHTPAWRTLTEGVTGPDAQELNADLVALGDATRSQLDPNSDDFGTATAAAVKKLQADLGADQTGSLTLGQVVFLPSALRITDVAATLGSSAQSGTQVLQATSTTRLVTATLDAAQISEIKPGDKATITLPDNHTTPGMVSSIGTVATSPSGGSSGGSGSSGPPTVQVDITPTDPSATGTVDQAPVQVGVTTDTARSVLAVPVVALVTTASRHPAVEVTGKNALTHPIPVRVGLFDDDNGLVEISGTGLAAGQYVLLPAGAVLS